MRNNRRNGGGKLTQKNNFLSPKVIFGATFVVWAIIMVDSFMQHNGIIINILLTMIFWGLGVIAYRTTQKPGQLTRQAAREGVWKALWHSMFRGSSKADHRDARVKRSQRNHR